MFLVTFPSVTIFLFLSSLLPSLCTAISLKAFHLSLPYMHLAAQYPCLIPLCRKS